MIPTGELRAARIDTDGILSALGVRSHTQGADSEYLVISGSNGPRWLIPTRSELAAVILREWRPYRPMAQASWFLIRMAVHAGALKFLPGVARAAVPQDASRQLLSFIGKSGKAAPPLVLAGNPSSSRKLIVFLDGQEPNSLEVIKLPLTQIAIENIRHEAATLERLDGSYGAPRLLHFSERAGASTQQYLLGKPGSRRLKPEYLSLLLSLIHRDSSISLSIYAQNLRNNLVEQPDYPAQSRPIDAALQLLDLDAAVPASLVHGDFAPWNIREMRDRSCALIDWESAHWGGLPLHDLCHFFYMQAKLFAPGLSFYSALVRDGSQSRYLSAAGIAPSLCAPLTAAFLLETLHRSWKAGATEDAEYCLLQLERFLEMSGKHNA